MPLRVQFDPPRHGWLPFRIEADDVVLAQSVSYVPNDAIHDLLGAILSVAKGMNEAKADWHMEPVTLEFLFTRKQDDFTLTITQFGDYQKGPREADVLLRVSGTFREVCRPFWKALRDLQGRMANADIDQGWLRPFPQDAMDRLNELVRSM